MARKSGPWITHTHTVACFGHVTLLSAALLVKHAAKVHISCAVLYLACHIVVGVAGAFFVCSHLATAAAGWQHCTTSFVEKRVKCCTKVPYDG